MKSQFLESRKTAAKELVMSLKKYFSYVSILGTDVRCQSVASTTRTSSISDEGLGSECGFVLKMKNNKGFFEYSLDDISGDINKLTDDIISNLKINDELLAKMIDTKDIKDEEMVKSFQRESDFNKYSINDLMAFVQKLKDEVTSKSENIINVSVSIGTLDVSKLFITEHKMLDQNYTWVNGNIRIMWKENGKVTPARCGTWDKDISKVLDTLPKKIDSLISKAHHLAYAKPIEPGVYDVITDPSITGLIAHEAFGHGVEMDMFVKDRAKSKEYINKYVASELVSMHDGASSTLSAASYFFDDDGVLAHDTLIIDKGVLKTGISDALSAAELGTIPTGNGRRQSYKRKAYTRMTNTFFEGGTNTLEEMVASVDYGYMIFDTNNGMEDPKNWGIQCTALYGKEIKDGKFTGNIISPVVMSGYVIDLLTSISMISKDVVVTGSGSCGKGYKEWVRVSDGGACLKAKVKIG